MRCYLPTLDIVDNPDNHALNIKSELLMPFFMQTSFKLKMVMSRLNIESWFTTFKTDSYPEILRSNDDNTFICPS